MDSHVYTRELLGKHSLPELKEIAQCFSLVPEGNKIFRETWIAALVGMPFPTVRLLDYQPRETIENPPAVDRAQEPIDLSTEKSLNVGDLVQSRTQLWGIEKKPLIGTVVSLLSSGGVRVCFGAGGTFDFSRSLRLKDLILIDRAQEPIETSPGVEVDPVEEPLAEEAEKSLDADRVQELIDIPDLESALAEIAQLRAQNEKLLELVRSQSEQIRQAKDISPVEKPSLKRVLALARAACLDVLKSAEGNWVLSMGCLRRSFKKLRDIWDLLIAGDWYLMDLFSPPPLPVAKKSIFAAASHTRYSAIPFADDGLIDTWSLGIDAVSSGRSPPAGGEAM